jgi:GDSL-like Lipase/Acylhydrolase family
MKKWFTASVLLNFLLVSTGIYLTWQYPERISKILFPPTQVAIVLMGDSHIAAGHWHFKQQYHIAAFGGACTAHHLWHIHDDVLQYSPSICIVNGGINDLLLGVPIQQIVHNLTATIDTLQAHRIRPILHHIFYVQQPDSVNLSITILNKRIDSLCQYKHISCLNLNPYIAPQNKLIAAYTTDGLHLSPQAYQIWEDILATCLMAK